MLEYRWLFSEASSREIGYIASAKSKEEYERARTTGVGQRLRGLNESGNLTASSSKGCRW